MAFLPAKTNDVEVFLMFKQFSLFKIVFSILFLAVIYFAVQWVTVKFRSPNQMGIIESMSMDMAVQVPEGAMPVEIQKVTQQPFSATVTYTGQAKAYNDIPIFPRVEGWLVSLPVYPGDRVKKGQLLAKLDSDELSSTYRSAHFSQKQSQEAIDAAKANLDYWTSEIKRAEALVKEEVITPEEYDREKSQYESADSQYQQTLAKHQATISTARTQSVKLGYTTIKAPVDGVITERPLDLGVLVKSGMEILRMAQLSPIRIQANVSESDFDKITVGKKVWIWQGLHQNGSPIQATVSSVFPNKDLATRTAVIEAVLPNNDGQFVPGDFVTMGIEVARKEATLAVLSTALVEKDRETAVWVVKDDKAHLQYVTTGGEYGEQTEIVTGLQLDDSVITRGHQDLLEGYKVVAAEFDTHGLKTLPQVSQDKRLSKANRYQVKKSLRHWVMNATLKEPPATIGKNQITLQLTPLHGELPSNLLIEAKSFMPAMPKMMVPKPSVTTTGTGRYQIKTQLPMAGLWQVDLTIKKGKQVTSEVSLEVEVLESEDQG